MIAFTIGCGVGILIGFVMFAFLSANREESRVRELFAVLEAITSASDSDNAQGGEMWWAETVYPHVEAAKTVISKAKGAQ